MIDPIRSRLERHGKLVDDLRDWSSGRFRIETGPLTEDELEAVRRAAPAFFVGIVAFLHFGDYVIVYGLTLMALMITIGSIKTIEYIKDRV